MSRPGAIVVGAGIAGLSAAIALARAGWSVELFERAPELRAVGAALSLWPNAVAGLRRLGAAARIEAEAAPIARMRLATRGGTTLLDRRVDGAAYLPTRALLQSALLDAIGGMPLHLGCVATSLDPGRGEVLFADGQRRIADLVVVADGLHSTLAHAITGGRARYRGYTGVVALSDPVSSPPTGIAAEWWGRHERFGVFDRAGGGRYWFHMHTARADDPPLAWPELMARAERWPEAVGEAVAATPAERLIAWPVYAKSPPRRLALGRVVCVGDAGHAMEPNLGQGACQAIEDAVALGAAASREQPGEVPRVFEAMRLARVRQVVRRSAEGGWATHGPVAVQAAMRAGLRWTPAGVQERSVGALQVLPGY